MALKVSEKIEKQREVLAAKQAAQNAARDRQQQLLDTPLSKITSQQIELMDSATYKAMLVKHGEAFAAKSLPLPTGVRRVVSSDSTAPVFTRDVLARQISPEHQALIDDSIRKSRLAEVEEGARILSAAQEKKEAARIAKLFSTPYTGPFALILDEAVRMTDARYEELGKVSKEDVGNSARLARMMSQNEYPIGHENPAGWDGQKLTDDEAAKITKFCAAQNPAIDFLDECNWYLAYLVLKCEKVIRYVPKVHVVKLEDEPTPVATEEINPFPKGSREWEQYERKAHDFNRFLEIDKSIGDYIVEIQDASNMRVPADAEEFIYNELTKRRLPFSRENVRRAFFAKWFREVPAGVFTQDEMNQWREEARVDGLSAADYLQENVLGTPVQWQQGKR